MIFGLDRHHYALDLPAAQLHIGGVAVTLTAGVYWTHDSAPLHGTYPSIYIHLCSRLAATLGGSWAVEPITPGGYSLRSGVRLVRLATTAAVVDWDQTTPIIKQLLGWPAGQAGTSALALVGSTRILDGPWAAVGSWCPWSMFDGRASAKDPMPERVQEWSSDHPEVAKSIVWRERRLRVWSYPLVYGAYALRERAAQAALAQQGSTAQGDDHNTLERLWESAGRDLYPVIVAPDQTSLAFNVGGSYEIYKLASKQAAQQLGTLLTRSQIAADIWDVKLPTVIIGGSYEL